MSNYKSDLQTNNSALSSNNVVIQSLIKQANSLPDYNNIELDTTLSVSGKAADAMAVGDALFGKSDVGHTHKYAGSSSDGGAATSANKLSTTRTIALNGAVSGSASFDGSKDISITTTNGQHISNKNSGTRYYKLGTMVTDDSGNYGNITISGRLGGWEQSNSANFDIMMLNRSSAKDGNTITATVSASGMVTEALSKCDIVVYRQDDTSEIVYLKLNGYWLYDFDWSAFQHSISYNTTDVTPTGTLVWSLSDAPKTILDTSGNYHIGGDVYSNGEKLATETKVNELIESSGGSSDISSQRFIVTATLTNDDTLTDVSATFEEIKAAYNSGKDVVLHASYYEGDIFSIAIAPLVDFVDEELIKLITFSAFSTGAVITFTYMYIEGLLGDWGAVRADIPKNYTYSDTDLIAGSSALETGKLYFVYE